ncbi:unnamed protein product [Pleuronectes platessa]|uniref:CFAP61 dimerisation domain-containing protein n=1 Tax=Pleuronectes platessa TaxID=8262 RepID=A0A9N7Z0Z6_PLEPL|nr:unnamed protein product [Pleuronectes platessa]
MDVYTTVETLLSLGVRGSRIHVVLPPPEPDVSCLRDPAVDRAVGTATEEAGVQVHRSCLLAQMNNGENPDPLTSVSFSTDTEPLRLQCGVFINLSNRGVDSDAFRSISGSFLVFDRRLVISSSFLTSDPDICGAGPVTKFSRCYYSDEWAHASFNSKEVGQELAAMMLLLVDPDPGARGGAPLGPGSSGAALQTGRGKLPGGFNYLHFTKPAASNLTDAPAPHLEDRGIVTGRVETGDYFCLHLDCLELVETITCFSLKPLPVSNYLSLYGKHQQLLGQMLSRYHQSLIPDLYSFFRQSWCLAVYHDRFSDFELELQTIASQTLTDDESSVMSEDGFNEVESRAALRSGAVKYLSYNENLLPMFACSGQL